MLPQRWRELLDGQDAQLLLRMDGDELQVHRQGRGIDERVGSITMQAGQDVVAAFRKLVGETGARQSRCFLLRNDMVLRRRLPLPAAAVANARTLLGFEIDRQTPFRADQVQYDYRVLPADAGSRQLLVELAVVPRERLRAELERLGPLARELDAVDIDSGGAPAGFNFLTPEQRRPRDRRPLLINFALAALSALFLLLAMAQLVDNRREAVARLEADVEAQRAAARTVGHLRKQLEDAVQAANFLATQKQQQPSMLMLLRTLTQALPDDTFVERLTASNGNLSMTVQSGRAAQLVERLQKAPGLSNPALLGAVQPDPRSGKDRATLTAQYGATQEAGNAPLSGG